jgi:hypothetical protein
MCPRNMVRFRYIIADNMHNGTTAAAATTTTTTTIIIIIIISSSTFSRWVRYWAEGIP